MTTTQSCSSFHFLDAGVLALHLETFLEKLESDGYSRLTRNNYRDSVAHLGTWMQLHDIVLAQVSQDVMARFERHRCMCPGGRRRKRMSRHYVRRVQRFVRYLQIRGTVPVTLGPPVAPRNAMLDEFRSWLSQHRGLKPQTVTTYLYALERFLPSLSDDPAHYDSAAIRRVVFEHARSNSIVQTKHMITSLRAWLRFLAAMHRCAADLATAVPTVPHWRLSSMPRYISADAVERLIASCNPQRAAGLRDRAVLLLLARLGLRAGDILHMQLADIDWHEGTVQVAGKTRRASRLPLPQDAGDAVLHYLERARPDVAYEQLFLRVVAPYRPLSSSGIVSGIVRAALRRAGIDAPSRGAHLLRHSAATAMLRSGATLDTVSTVLRHRSADTTAYYAKVDILALNAIAQPWPEGASC